MRRKLLVCLLVLFAGCSGLNGGTSAPQPTDTPSPVQPTTNTPGDIPADATTENTVPYTALSAVEKRAFDAARRGEVAFAPESIRDSPAVNRTFYPEDSEKIFQNHEYVRKNGSYFRLSWDYGPAIAMHGIQTTAQQPPENATVVAVENLSPRVQEVVRKAIENGSYSTPPGEELPAGVENVEYVRDGKTSYKISVVIGDFRPKQMRVEPLE